MKKRAFIVILIIVTVTLGFLRDYIFVSINQFIDAGVDVNGRLSILKWALTFLFSLLYLIIACIFLHILFGVRKYMWMAAFSYILLLGIALLSAALGYFFSSFASVYPFIRSVLGVAQSPIVAMVLISICYFDVKMHKANNKN